MSGHLDGPPPGPPDPPYIPGDMGAPSAEEFAHKRGVGSGDELVTDYISGDAASLRFVERMTPEERARFDEQIDAAFADPPRNPYHAGLPHGLQLAQAWGRGFAAARVSTRDETVRPWPIAPDTEMPPRRRPVVRWGSRADDVPTEIHDDPEKTRAYLAGLAAGRTESAAAVRDTVAEIVTRLNTLAWQQTTKKEQDAVRAAKEIVQRFGGSDDATDPPAQA